MKISVIITSGGSSVRFGSNKLLANIGNMTVIETTISKFIDIADEIVIPSKGDIVEFLKKSQLMNNKIKFAPFGLTRQKSVYNGLLVCDNPDVVLIHDGARPFVKRDTILKTIDAVKEKKAVLAGIMALDTIKEIEGGRVIRTLDRNKIFQAQTPQAFDYKLIKEIHEFYKDRDDFTDDSSMAEQYGIDVYIVEGSKDNIKITTKDDLKY